MSIHLFKPADPAKPAFKTLLGSQACAQGAHEAAVRLVTGYPGTPATPAVEYLLGQSGNGLKAEWSVNEKVALEVAAGHSWAGQRSFVAMKMSGLNVASDPLLSIAASGTVGGLVILVGDDPGVYYGMVEQDSRLIARMAVLPMIEPANPNEARVFTRMAFEVSEQTQAPILIRQTGSTANTYSKVQIDEPERLNRKPTLPDDLARYTKASAQDCMDQHAQAMQRLEEAGEAFDELNIVTEGDTKLGVIAAGSVWSYLEECLASRNGASTPHCLRVTVMNPLPDRKIVELLGRCKRVVVIEELEPLIEERVRALAHSNGIKVEILGKEQGIFKPTGDFDPELVELGLKSLEGADIPIEVSAPELGGYAPRKPTFCPGCPHRSSYSALNKAIRMAGFDPEEVMVTGDIGCTILGMYEPFSLCRTEVVMGASISLAQGFSYAGVTKPIIATIGDSTFFHSGIPALLNAASREINLTVLVLDNSYAAMTGFQPTAATQANSNDMVENPMSLYELSKAVRVRRVRRAFPYLTGRLSRILSQAIRSKGVNVIIAEAPCAARRQWKRVIPYSVNPNRCVGLFNCEATCVDATGCAAITRDEESGKAAIDQALCMGCGLCASACVEKAVGRNVRSLRRNGK